MWEGLIERPDRRRTARPGGLRRALVLFVTLVAAIPPVVLSILGLAAATASHAHAAANPGFTEFPLTSGYVRPLEIALGPDGNLWFTELTGPNIGRITPAGTITEFPVPANGSFLQTGGMVAGPDGNMWFTDAGNNSIGQITTSGVITEFPIPTASTQTRFITLGPDGNLWFSELNTDKVGRITTAGVITEFPISAGSSVQFITSGPDGNLWFTEQNIDKVGRITPTGTLTEFAMPSGSQPWGIVAGPDGNMWITENGTSNIAVMSTSGTVLNQYPVVTPNAGLAGIKVGSNGNLWFAEFGGSNEIGEVTTGGAITEFPQGTGSGAFDLATGADGNMWYTGFFGPTIGRFAPGSCASLADSASASAIAPGVSETISVNLTSCGVADLPSSTTTTTTTAPSGCAAAPGIPSFTTSSLPYGQTDPHATTFAAPSCLGTYTVNSQTSVGSTVVASGSTSYTVQVACLSDSAAPSPVPPGGSESVGITLTACGGVDVSNATTTTTTIGPPTCPPAPAIPAYTDTVTSGQSVTHNATLTAPTCGGDYNVASQTTLGTIVVASATTKYHVLTAGDGVLFPAPCCNPKYITSGSDGNLWWTNGLLNQITPSGTVTTFPGILPGGAGQIVAGTDGSLYVVTTTQVVNDSVAQVKINGCCGPSFAWQVPAGAGTNINDLEPGVDGNMWFTAGSGRQGIVGFVTPTAKYKNFNLPAGSGVPFSITAGPDDAMWFTLDSGQVGRITTAGAVTFVAMPAGLNSGDIALGPDGNFWMTVGRHTGNGTTPNYVLRMTPSGAFTQFTTPTPDVGAGSITTGADGNLWFNEPWLGHPALCGTAGSGAGGVGRITTAGVITEFDASCSDFDDAYNIVAGPDGYVWNGSYYGAGIVKIEVGWSGACTPLTASVNPASVRRGSPETIAAMIANCSTIPQLMQLQTKTMPPSTCHTASTTTTRVPLGPHVETLVSGSSTAQCKGTYNVKLTLRVGSQIVATKSVTYTVS